MDSGQNVGDSGPGDFVLNWKAQVTRSNRYGGQDSASNVP